MTDSLEFGRLHWPVLSWNVLSSLTYVCKWALKCEWPSVREVREILITKMKPQKGLVLSSSSATRRESKSLFHTVHIYSRWMMITQQLPRLPAPYFSKYVRSQVVGLGGFFFCKYWAFNIHIFCKNKLTEAVGIFPVKNSYFLRGHCSFSHQEVFSTW